MDNVSSVSADVTTGTAFGREARLRNRWQLDVMRASGKKVVGRRFVLIALETPPDGTRRAAFLISRKYSLLAVERNRARRLFREVFRRIYGGLPPVWLLFIPRHRMKTAMLEDIETEALELLAQSGVQTEKETEC